MSTLRTFTVDGTAYQVLFTTNVSTSRLCRPRPNRNLEPVITTHCLLVDDNLRTVAEGLAICAEDDPYDYETGVVLALDRMLTDAEHYVRGWTTDTSVDVINAYYDETADAADEANSPPDDDFSPRRNGGATVASAPPPMNMFEASAVYKDVLRRQVERQVAETLVDTLTLTYIHPDTSRTSEASR